MNNENSAAWEEALSAAVANYKKQYLGTVQEEITIDLVSSDEETNSVVFVFRPTRRCKNQWDAVHGGVISMVFDAAMGITAKTVSKKMTTPTVNMQVSYMAPHKIDQPVYLKAKALSVGGRLAYMSADSFQSDQKKLCAQATGTYYLTSEPLSKL